MTGPAAADAYLDLVKRCLTRYSAGEVFLAPAPATRHTADELETGRAAHQDADTMIGWRRLDNLQECVESVLRDGVPGDLAETGCWRGGSCILMRAVLRAWGVTDRTVWAADSFGGFPDPDPAAYPADAFFDTPAARDYLAGLDYSLAVGLDDVRARFRSYDLLDDQVRFLPGFFADTLPDAPIERLAVLRLDGDFYQSTYEALRYLYPRLSIGGYCIVDDFSLSACRRAVQDYRSHHGITEPVETIDWTGVFWRRTG